MRFSHVIEYRSFRNYDPPHLLRLWQQAGLGWGAAVTVSNDESFDYVNYAQQHFDRAGLIVAVDGALPIGFVHAGFGCTEDGSRICKQTGVIYAVIVHPGFRRRGIAKELIRRAEEYLREAGAETIFAGPGPKRDLFYFGLYGGARPVGFLESDPVAASFIQSVGYEPVEKYSVTERGMADRDPVNFRLTKIRRQWELALVDHPDPCPWYWMVRYGRLDALYCVLVPKEGGLPAAGLTVVGLDRYIKTWGEQTIGIVDLRVEEQYRGQGFGQALILDVIKRLRQETITKITANIDTSDEASIAVFQSAGFRPVDQGIVYRSRS
ncbi:MAG: GNAT family N-acetyltransferase [Planctomycetota bacterium]|nr:GNAT family N-acetyltransferase [Planctomycetota bacterium]